MKHLASAPASHDDGIWCCAWAANDRLLTGSVDESIKLWSVTSAGKIEHVKTLSTAELGVISIAVTPDGTKAVSSSLDSNLRIWDLASNKCLTSIDCGPVENWDVAISTDSKLVATGSQSGSVNLWDIASATKVQTLETAVHSMVMSVAYSPNGRYLACGARDGGVTVFDLATMKQHLKLEGHNKTVRTLAFTGDSSTLVTGCDDMRIKLFDMRAGQIQGNLLDTCSGHASWVLSVACTPDSKSFVTGSSDNTVKVWDISKRECTKTFNEHKNQVWRVAVNGQGSLLASVSDDKSISVYSMAD
eukprot:c1712_g1_i2.p1 GENE.c1712_g1_i2~~c1712_g1_i2.p1  ORF type:complete len:317 (+),score=78.60 c1712_g1_i2:45-953(+)